MKHRVALFTINSFKHLKENEPQPLFCRRLTVFCPIINSEVRRKTVETVGSDSWPALHLAEQTVRKLFRRFLNVPRPPGIRSTHYELPARPRSLRGPTALRLPGRLC